MALTKEELIKLIEDKCSQQHDYNTSAQAVVDVAIAAFDYMASEMGLTGFQAGWCSFEIMRHTLGINGPFGIIKAENMLYPQYDEVAKVQEWQRDWASWLRDEATKRLAEDLHAAPRVRLHWARLANAPKEV